VKWEVDITQISFIDQYMLFLRIRILKTRKAPKEEEGQLPHHPSLVVLPVRVLGGFD
jgi:hypothetical protein